MATNRQTASHPKIGLPTLPKSILPLRLLASRLVGVVTILTTLLSLGFGPPALTESDAAKLPVYSYQLPTFVPRPLPKLTARSAVVVDFDTGRVVWERNSHARVAPASTTKMMTAIVAMEQGRLTDKVTVEWKHLVGWASMGLQPGDVLTLEDLLWGMLLPSANEAAEAIADHVGGGSTDNFVKMMNDKAIELGLHDTQFKNPHGLDEEGHYSSAYDLAVIARKALQYPLISKMAATTEWTVSASRTYKLYNSNNLLRMQDVVPGVDGFKTGYTEDAGNCLVATTTRNGHRLITVVMNAEDRNKDSIELINWAFDNFVWTPLPTPVATQIRDESDRPRVFEITGKRDLLIRPWERWWIALSLNLISNPEAVEPSTTLGFATYSIAGTKAVEFPLRLKE